MLNTTLDFAESATAPDAPPAPLPSGISAPGGSSPPDSVDNSVPLLALLPPPPVPGSAFARGPGETPRAFSAFTHFFQLGHSRSLPAVAEQLDENLSTIKKWSARFRWNDRILAFNAGILQHQAETQAAAQRSEAADWAQRTRGYRESEWETAQKLLGAVQCFLESFGDRDVEKMTLSQVSRAFQISSSIARQALGGAAVPDGPTLVPLQLELAAALKKAYAHPPADLAPAPRSDGVSPAVPNTSPSEPTSPINLPT